MRVLTGLQRGVPDHHLHLMKLSSLLALCLGFLSITYINALEVPGKGISVDGDIHRFKLPDGVTVSGGPTDGTFDEEIYGKSFTISASNLPAGTYSIVVNLAEVYRKGTGQRLMKIACGDTVLADNLDIFAQAGFAKAFQVTGKVTHQDDSMLGPLVVTFTSIKDSAKFNGISILDDKGNLVTGLKVKDLVDPNVAASKIPVVNSPVIYTDPTKAVDRRVDDLISRMSLAEKVGELGDGSRAIPRLNVPEYHYWNECLHGVARAGVATVFPQAIGLAATWNTPLVHQEADVISTEGRAIYNQELAKVGYVKENYYGLTYWTPNINIFRDPRWGRGQETYGEDPYLTAQIGISFIKGIQGDDPHYYKALACAKHFAVHSGPEKGRDEFNSMPPTRDLYETYLPQFEAAVKEGHVGCVMSSYNALNGVPNSANSFLLNDTLRKQWGFQGYVVSDCGAVYNIWTKFHFTKGDTDGVAEAYKSGLDMECGGSHGALVNAVAKNLITEQDLDVCLRRIFTARFKLGMFDPPSLVPWSNIPASEIDSPAHGELNREVARQSMVLLKNDGVLPIDKAKVKSIVVIGPNAQSKNVLQGNYSGTMSHPIVVLDGIQTEATAEGIQVTFAKGCPLRRDSLDPKAKDTLDALQAAKNADLVIFVGGIDGGFEGEGYDRQNIELPEDQTEMLQALQATGKPVVFVDCSGSPVAFPWAAANIPAILQAWYPGGEGGAAVADVLFGKYNPAGRLPVTFYEKTADLPDLTNYSMANRTYRYFTGKPLYPFGFGLSYTTFAYSPAVVDKPEVAMSDTLHFSVPVKNTGSRDGDEVVQVYLHHQQSPVSQPIRSLVGFKRVTIAQGATVNVPFDVPVSLFRYWSEAKKDYTIDAGKYDIQIGASSSHIRQSFVTTVKE